MIQRHASFLIDLQNRKGGAVDRLCDAKSLCQSLCQHGFANAKIAYQRVDSSRFCSFTELFSKCERIVRTQTFDDHRYLFSAAF